MTPRKRVSIGQHIGYLPGIHPALMPASNGLTAAHKSQIREVLRRTKNARKPSTAIMEETTARARPTMKLSGKALLARARFDRAMNEIKRLMAEYAKLTGKSERSIFYSHNKATDIYGELNKLSVNNTFHITIGSNHIAAAKQILEVAKKRLQEAKAKAN
ncbi:MAG: hypothetical protein WC746_05460 [archaeon]